MNFFRQLQAAKRPRLVRVLYPGRVWVNTQFKTTTRLSTALCLTAPDFRISFICTQLSAAFRQIWSSCNGCLHNLAKQLRCRGYDARHAQNRAHASHEGFCLPHSFVTVVREKGNGLMVIDPFFQRNWDVPHPTSRYAALHRFVIPDVVIAPLPQLLKATAVLCEELERCFRVQALSLPPWRTLRNTLARWSTTMENMDSDDEAPGGEFDSPQPHVQSPTSILAERHAGFAITTPSISPTIPSDEARYSRSVGSN
jgi:uncharacterized protein (TIGR01615 family)